MAKSKIIEFRSTAYPVVFIMAPTHKALVNRVNKDFPDFEVGGPSRGRTTSWWTNCKLHIAVFAETPAHLAHECIHAKNAIMELTGITSNFNNDEAEAYMAEYVFREYAKAVRPEWL